MNAGLALGLLASALWGSVFAAGRYLVDARGLDPLFVGALRFNGGAAAVMAFLLLRGQKAALRDAACELPLLSVLGAVGIFGMGAMVFLSAQHTASINTSIIINANPIFIALFAPLIGERVPLLRVLGLLVGLLGCVVIGLGDMIGGGSGGNDLLGCALAMLGACFWAAYTVFGKGVSQRRGGLPAAAWCLLTGALLYVPVAALRGGLTALEPGELAVALYLAVGPTAIAMPAWYRALELVDANVLGPTQYVATLVGTLLGRALLGEKLGRAFLGGGAAVIAGLWLATRPAGEARATDAS